MAMYVWHVRVNMELEDLQRKLSLASRHVFMKVNHDASQMKKNYLNPIVYVVIDGNKFNIKDIKVEEYDIYIETEKQ